MKGSTQELYRYAKIIVACENARCKRFERGLCKKIRTLVIVIAKWTDFSRLVENTLRVKQSLMEKEEPEKKSKQVITITGDNGKKEQDYCCFQRK